eukprot:TRINITY_DN8840_c0_g1_i2.p2 TRINITY_DN8840_c0_g1~~TRINITY_DN8840_c0_g1_i2.p2  ORF type:complete len:120 (+),score=21.06 TRINITY_DN8840_c0_g1_i2:106-465(+)
MCGYGIRPDKEKAAYGFALWLSTGAALVAFVVWSLGWIPRDSAFPHVYWCLGGTAVLAVTLITYLTAVNLMIAFRVVEPESWGAVTDSQAMLPRVHAAGGLPLVADIPIADATRFLYKR